MAFLYEVSIDGGPGHKEYTKWKNNVQALNAQTGDFAGIQRVCVLKHHQPANVVHVLCTDGMKRGQDVEVEEITRDTLEAQHCIWRELFDDYFSPFDDFPNIDEV